MVYELGKINLIACPVVKEYDEIVVDFLYNQKLFVANKI